MEDYGKLIESLLERISDYLKTNIELTRLKLADKASDVLSSLISQTVVFVFVALFLLFSNIGLALWLGKLLGSAFFGFFVVAAFYGMLGLVIRLFCYQWMKRKVSDFFIKQLFK
ncbi:MAG: phage holin family protein [Bacteroidota bacterium]|nr:phage holin family protein [Bacteroidota bacterium]